MFRCFAEQLRQTGADGAAWRRVFHFDPHVRAPPDWHRIELHTAGVSVDSFSYTSSLASADGVSMNRNPDATVGAEFALHNTVSTLTASAGKRANGTAF